MPHLADTFKFQLWIQVFKVETGNVLVRMIDTISCLESSDKTIESKLSQGSPDTNGTTCLGNR